MHADGTADLQKKVKINRYSPMESYSYFTLTILHTVTVTLLLTRTNSLPYGLNSYAGLRESSPPSLSPQALLTEAQHETAACVAFEPDANERMFYWRACRLKLQDWGI